MLRKVKAQIKMGRRLRMIFDRIGVKYAYNKKELLPCVNVKCKRAGIRIIRSVITSIERKVKFNGKKLT